MIKLRNIKTNNVIIECDVFPEDSLKAGHISVDIRTAELLSSTLPSGYEWCENHVNHAKRKLVDFIGKDEIPEEKILMWH